MNIYNKIFQTPNGTLIANWYEEQCLRNKTGVGRTIPAVHIKKRAFDLDQAIKFDPEKRNDTFARTIGENRFKEWRTTNSTYGDFKNAPNKKMFTTISERLCNDFFKNNIERGTNPKFNNIPIPHQITAASKGIRIEPREEPEIVKIADAGKHLADKINRVCTMKGWLGLRKFKNYLLTLVMRKSTYIHIEDTKMYFVNYGICLEERELNYMINTFQNSKNEINFFSLIESVVECNDQRMNLINVLLQELKAVNGAISKEVLLKMFNPDIHPEVIYYKISDKELVRDYADALDNMPITDEEFIKLFKEISSCIPEDNAFKQVLRACGYQD